jgi:Mn2+/Fe2+ NRAMP family transporter
MILLFIIVSAIVFIMNGQPVQTLVFVGLLNGFTLPFALGIILLAAYRRNLVGSYRHPWWLTLFGVLVVLATLWFGIQTLLQKVA